MKKAQERRRTKIILNWLAGQLDTVSLTPGELEKRFTADFCEKTPRVFTLTGMDYFPTGTASLMPYLNLFVKQKKILHDEGKYWFLSR
jgi:hypothetical protein